MGLFKLALIGGAAYWAGKKFNEKREGEAWNQHGYQGPCSRRRRSQDPNQPDQSQVYGPHPGTNRDMPPYQDYPEKTRQQEYQDMNQYPAGNVHGHGYQRERSLSQPALGYDGKKMIKYQAEEQVNTNTPPAYTGTGRMSPQMRMYPGENGVFYQDSKRPYAVEQPMWK